MLYLCGRLAVSVVDDACISVGMYLHLWTDTCNKHRLYLLFICMFYANAFTSYIYCDHNPQAELFSRLMPCTL